MNYRAISQSKDVRKIVSEAVNRGWTVEHGAKHSRLVSPDGKSKITINGSPSDYRVNMKLTSDIKRIEKDLLC
jgi:hypothetical protein